MKYIAIIVSFTLFVACTNKQPSSYNCADVDSRKDSILLAQQKDSVERNRLFEALGDTAFGSVCYGMDKPQYQKALDVFKKPLKSDEDYHDFVFARYKFHADEGSDVEKNNNKTAEGYPYGLDNILKEDRLWTYFFKGKLVSIRWNSSRIIQDGQSAVSSLGQLVSYFEKRYGPPNANNTKMFNSSVIETGTWHQMKVIARWETEKKKIVIFYRDLVGSERDKWMEDNYPSDYQYELTVIFLDKIQKKEVDDYIKPIIQKYIDDYNEHRKQDSINNANAL